MKKQIQKLESNLLESNRLQDLGSKRTIPSNISECLNISKNQVLDNIVDFNDMSKVKSQDLYTMGNN